jgi:hypothetical protein
MSHGSYLSLDTAVPHIRQHISLPLNSVEVAEDVSHYTAILSDRSSENA